MKVPLFCVDDLLITFPRLYLDYSHRNAMASLNNMDLPSPLELILDTEFDTIIQDFAAKALIPGVSILIHRHENAQRASETTFKAYGVAYDEEPVTENVSLDMISWGILGVRMIADCTESLPNLLDD